MLLDAIEDYAIFLLGPTGEIRSWNIGATRTMGYEAPEVIGSHFRRFYPPEAVEQQKPESELAIAGKEGRIEDEGWRIRKDGTRFWANTVITALRNPDGSVRGFAKVTRDLSNRRAAEESLRQSEEIFRLLVNSVKEYAIFLLDPTGHVVTWNAGAQRIKGYTAKEIIGHHFSQFYPEEDKWKPAKELELAKRDGWVEDEGWRLRKDGTRFWANVVITAVFGPQGDLRGFTKVTRDMTERKNAEETQKALLEQREARLQAEEERRRAEASYRASQEANRSKDEFLMTLSHELRTPMTSILGWARLLPGLNPTEETFREAVAAIGRSAQLQARLIDDVLDVSRIVSGKLRLHVENVDVLRVLASSIDTVKPSADAKGITITTQFAPHLGTLVADGTRLQQIVWNLLSNAVKFTSKDSSVNVSARRTASHIEISVADQGEGIDPGFLPHVFEPFRQAENPSTRVHGGLGLGLSIVRYLAEAHGGTVVAESTGRGKGATFTVTLPIGALALEQREEAAKEQNLTEPLPIRAERLRGLSIVLVDDDDEGRRLICALLSRAGATVRDVDAAGLVSALIKSERPDLVVTDLAMPGMDGYALGKELRRDFSDLKIVALSAFPAGRNAKDAIFDAYIAKPVEPSELIESIAAVAGR